MKQYLVFVLVLFSCNQHTRQEMFQIPKDSTASNFDSTVLGSWKAIYPDDFDIQLFLKNYNKDSISINYVVSYKDFIAGDVDKTLAFFLKKEIN